MLDVITIGMPSVFAVLARIMAFRSETSDSTKKNLIIFVTPTIIDPAGNRVHSPDNLPYDPNRIPEQKPVANP